MSNDGFIKLSRSYEVDELMENHPLAFLMLTKIARLAQRASGRFNYVKPGQALINPGMFPYMTRQQYRDSAKELAVHQKATFQGTNKGTIATLCDASIYDINSPTEEPPKEPKKNHQRTIQEPAYSSKNERMKEEKKLKANAHAIEAPASEEKNEEQPPPVTGGQFVLRSPEVYELFLCLFPGAGRKEPIAEAEWNKLKLDDEGYKDLVCRLMGQIDSNHYFSDNGKRDLGTKSPAIYLRDGRYNDLAGETQPYRKTFDGVVDWCVSRDKIILGGQKNP